MNVRGRGEIRADVKSLRERAVVNFSIKHTATLSGRQSDPVKRQVRVWQQNYQELSTTP